MAGSTRSRLAALVGLASGLGKVIATGFLLGTAYALLHCPIARAQISVQMTADSDRITLDQAVTVRISIEAAGDDSPEERLPSFDDFEVVRREVSRPVQFSFSFGRGGARKVFRSSTNYTFVLRPQAEGRFTIPPTTVTAGGKIYNSRPLTITVQPGAGGVAQSPPGPAALGPPGEPDEPESLQSDPGRAPDIPIEGARFDKQAFLRTVVDKAEAYVGEQVTVTIYLYLRGRLRSVPAVQTEPSTDGFWVRDLLPANRRLEAGRQVVDGTVFGVYVLRRFAAFPLRAGELTLGPMSLKIEQGTVFDPFDVFNRRSAPELQRSGVPVTLQIKPLPERGRLPGEVAVGRFQLEAKLDRGQAITGDAVTLTATVRGQGNLSAVRLEAPELEGLKVLQPQIRDLIEVNNEVVGGTRVFEWLLVPLKPGPVAIGSLTLPAFDPATGKYEKVHSPPLELAVVGKPLQSAEEAEAADREKAAETPGNPAYKFGPVRTSSALRRERESLVSRAWYGWLVAACPLGWLLVLSISAARRRLETNAHKSAPRRALQQAGKRLRAATSQAAKMETGPFYAEVTAALKAALEARLGEPIGGFTHPELREYLRQRGMSEELTAGTVDELKQCETARFSPAGESVEQREECAARARLLFKRLAGFDPSEQGGRR